NADAAKRKIRPRGPHVQGLFGPHAPANPAHAARRRALRLRSGQRARPSATQSLAPSFLFAQFRAGSDAQGWTVVLLQALAGEEPFSLQAAGVSRLLFQRCSGARKGRATPG